MSEEVKVEEENDPKYEADFKSDDDRKKFAQKMFRGI